jgi:hypothetical protein
MGSKISVELEAKSQKWSEGISRAEKDVRGFVDNVEKNLKNLAGRGGAAGFANSLASGATAAEDLATKLRTGTSAGENVTERRCPSLASLVGRHVSIIKQGGIWWSERWMDWPNDNVIAHGRVSGASAYTPVNGNIRPDSLSPSFTPTITTLVGCDILFWNAEGDGDTDGDPPILQRGRVTSDKSLPGVNFTGTVGVAVQGAEFVIIKADGYFRWHSPGAPPKPGAVRTDYWGNLTSYYSHDADDFLSSIGKPTIEVQLVLGFDPEACGDASTIFIYDKDFWTDVQEACSEPDVSYSPNLAKSYRYLWSSMEDIIDSYIDPGGTYEGSSAIPVLNMATWFASASINSQTVTGGTVSGGALPYSISAPYTPIDIWYSVKDATGVPILIGETTYTGSGDTLGTTLDDTYSGLSITVSLGPTRYVKRTFQRMKAKTCMIPDVDSSGTPTIVWPPTEDFPGSYQTRGASTHYLASDPFNFVAESTLAADAFVIGEYARYVGDNMGDPSVYPPTSDPDPQVSYHERFFNGTRSADFEASLAGLLKGQVTSGTAQQLTNSNLLDPDDPTVVGLWGGDFYIPAAVFVRTGTATGGSTTTLIDTTQSSSVFWNSSLRSQVGLVITITLAGVDYKRLVTAHAGTTVTFGEALPASASGAAYAFRETDGEANRYKGETVTVRQSAGGTIQTTKLIVAGNDDSTLFFTTAAPFTILPSASYSISNTPVRGVWKWDGAKWTIPAGADPRGSLHPDFLPDLSADLPTCVVRYGLPRMGDLLVTKNWQELYAAYNKIRWVGRSINWTNDPSFDMSGAENNHKEAAFGELGELGNIPGSWFSMINPGTDSQECILNESDYPGYWTDPMNQIINGGVFAALEPDISWLCLASDEPSYVAATADAEDDTMPFCYSHGEINYSSIANESSSRHTVFSAQRLYAYAKPVGIGQPRCPLASEIDYYAYAVVDVDDHDEGGSCSAPDGGGNVSWDEFVFDANHDDVLFRQYHKWYGESSPSTSVNRVSGSLGINELSDAPSPAPQPVPGTCFDVDRGLPGTPNVGDCVRRSTTGYVVKKGAAIQKFDVVGGMIFLD